VPLPEDEEDCGYDADDVDDEEEDGYEVDADADADADAPLDALVEDEEDALEEEDGSCRR